MIILKGNSKRFMIVHVDLETMLQDMIDKLIEIGRCYAMEMNVGGEKNRNIDNFKTTIPSKNYCRPKTIRECGIF